MSTKNIIYEQPLNEHIRLCLRLEHLLEEANYYLTGKTSWDFRQTINTILEILQTSDRPDLKNKLGQALTQYSAALSHIDKTSTLDKKKATISLKHIDLLIKELRGNTQKIGQDLRSNEFLMALQQRIYTPAGTCEFNLPSYHLWLAQDKKVIQQQLALWLSSFKQLQAIIDLMLKIIRDSIQFKVTKATGGFYQSTLDPTVHYQMIRIKTPAEENLYPEISVGRHRLAIHFFTIDINGRAAQTPNDVEFDLACCKL